MSIVGPGEGDHIELHFLPGFHSRFVVPQSASDSRMSAAVEDVPAGVPHGRHVHKHRDELFFLVSGQLEFSVGDEYRRVEPGTAIFAPRGVPHSFANPFDQPAQMLSVWSPGGTEGMYRAWEQAFSGPADFDFDKFVEIWRAFDTTPA